MEKKIFYVYKYVDVINEQPFYVGKGKDERKYSHIRNARQGQTSPLYNRIKDLGFEQGVRIEVVKDKITEYEALRLECKLIEETGRVITGNGPLLNKTTGGEGISGGIDKYGYRKEGIARKITDMVDKGILIQDMPFELRKYVKERSMNVKWVDERLMAHIQEMGNVGCHYKGPKITLRGWQFSLDRKMTDVNKLTLDTRGFLKVHGDLPFNDGYVSDAPPNYDFGY